MARLGLQMKPGSRSRGRTLLGAAGAQEHRPTLARHGNTGSDGHPPSGLDGGCPRIPAGESLELQHSKPEADASPTVPAAGQPATGWHSLIQLARTWIRLVCAGPALGRNRRSTPFLQLASMRSASISSDSVNERS